jgi:hypothetical protein
MSITGITTNNLLRSLVISGFINIYPAWVEPAVNFQELLQLVVREIGRGQRDFCRMTN